MPGSVLQPADAAIEYLREKWGDVLPLFLLAILPQSVAVYFLIDIISSQFREALPFYSALLVLATFWRWIFQAILQKRIQEDLRGEAVLPVRSRIWAILTLRLYACMAVTWGSFLVVPTIYGLVVGGCITPLLLEKKLPVMKHVAELLGLINRSTGRVVRLVSAVSFSFVCITLALVAFQFFFTETVLPHFLGMDALSFSATLRSGVWLLCATYFLWVLFDLFWTITGVMLFYELQARRLGTDLRLRLRTLRKSAALQQEGGE